MTSHPPGIKPDLLLYVVLAVFSIDSRAQTNAAASTPAVVGSNGFAPVLTATHSPPARRAAVPIEVPPYTPIHKVDDEGQIPEIEMFVGESRVFPTPGVARIAVGNGAAVTADALDGKEVILFANAVGTSSLFIWNADGRYQRVKINIVPGDTTRYAREIAAFLSAIPHTRASIVGANIVVEGDDLSESDLAKIDEMAKRYPQIVNFTNRIGWEQMIAMDVKVVEFPVTALTQLGLNWSPSGGAAVGAIWAPIRRGGAGAYQIDVPVGSASALPITSPADTTTHVAPSRLNLVSAVNLALGAQINLLAQQGKASLLAEPQLSTRSGSKASFLAGGEIPYTVSTRDGTYVQFKSYGVKLDITPRLGQGGVIRAAIQTEVSGIDSSVTASAGPALLSRKTETEFNVHAGETIVLSGLLQREVHDDVDKVPFLGDIPVLGALFRSKSYQKKETELVVFITPTLVDAGSPDSSDRIRQTGERLQEQMGPTPYLAPPHQPPSQPSVSDTTSPTPAEARDAREHLARSPEGALLTVTKAAWLRASPSADAAAIRPLQPGATLVLGDGGDSWGSSGQWRNVKLADISGWVRADAVVALNGRHAEVRGASTDGLEDSSPAVTDTAKRGPDPATLRRDVTPSASNTDASPAVVQRYRVQLAGLVMRLTPDINAGIVWRCKRGDLLKALPLATQGGWTAVEVGAADQARRGWVATEWLVPVTNP